MTSPQAILRTRNRIIEYFAWTATFDGQAAYAAAVPQVHVPHEVMHQWEDWVSPDWRLHFIEPIFSFQEIEAIARYDTVWDSVAAATPDPLPALEELFPTPEWQRLTAAADAAWSVFKVRGPLAEDPLP